jgi:hypothetical protein
MAERHLPTAILEFLADRARRGLGPAHPAGITTYVRGARPTVNRLPGLRLAGGDTVHESGELHVEVRHTVRFMRGE